MKHRSSRLVACASLILSSALGCSQEVPIGAYSNDGPNGSGGGSNDPNAAGGGSNDPNVADGGSNAPKALCGFSTLASGTDGRASLALHEDTLYWARSADIKTVPLAGGASTNITGGILPDTPKLAFNATGVYWGDVEAHALMGMPLGGDTPVMVVRSQGLSDQIAVDAENVYWIDFIGAGETRVMKAALAGGEPVTVVPVSADYITSLAVDDEAVYWSTLQGGGMVWAGKVMKLPKAGGAAVTIASGLKAPGNIVVDAENVYWAGLVGDVPAQDVIMKAPKSGGTPSVIVATRQPASFAVNETGVYWVEYDYSMPSPDKPGDIDVIASHFMTTSNQANAPIPADEPFPGIALGPPVACPGGACFLAVVADGGGSLSAVVKAAVTVMRYGPCP